jgi:hypothetical protein
MPEVLFPGSSDPFRPLNPWGRSMPKSGRRAKAALYQLVVTRGGKEIRLGPKMERQFVDQLYETVLNGIRCGAEKELSNPHIVAVVSSEIGQRRETVGDLLNGVSNATFGL